MQFTFKHITSVDFKRDPFPICRAMREQGPFFPSRVPIIGKVHFGVAYEAVDTMLRDRNRFVLEAKNAGVKGFGDYRTWLPRTVRVLSNNMLQKDEPDHRRLRNFAEMAFLRKNVDGMRDDITKLADGLIDKWGRAGQFDLANEFSRELPMSVICELLGLPNEDRSNFSRWAGAFSNASFPWGMFMLVPAIMRLNRYLRKQFQVERTSPRGGLISELVAAEQEGSQLNEDELLAMTFVLFLAGHETTTHLISLTALTLLEREDLRDRWMSEPDKRLQFLDELMRYLTPVQMTKPRFVAEDTTIAGYQLKRGEKVMGILTSANSDPEKFDNAESIDFDRKPNQHLGFGGGIHFCLGAQLARIETEIGITRLLERHPSLRLAIDKANLRWNPRTGMRALHALPLVA